MHWNYVLISQVLNSIRSTISSFFEFRCRIIFDEKYPVNKMYICYMCMS